MSDRVPTLPHCVWSLPPRGLALLGAARRCGRSPPRSLTGCGRWTCLRQRRRLFGPSKPARAGLEPRASAPRGLALPGAARRCGRSPPRLSRSLSRACQAHHRRARLRPAPLRLERIQPDPGGFHPATMAALPWWPRGPSGRAPASDRCCCPLQPLHLNFGGDAEIRTLKGAEWVGGHVMPTGDALMSGYYLNELLLRLLARDDPHPGLFDAYAAVVRVLAGHGSPQVLASGLQGEVLHVACALLSCCCCVRSACCPCSMPRRSRSSRLIPMAATAWCRKAACARP
jgi:hypothetical protein